MSTVELAVQEVKSLTESEARELLAWLRSFKQADHAGVPAADSHAACGFARRYRSQPRSTADWMKELREGES